MSRNFIVLGLLLSLFIIPLTVTVSDAQFLKKSLDKCRKDQQEYKDKVSVLEKEKTYWKVSQQVYEDKIRDLLDANQSRFLCLRSEHRRHTRCREIAGSRMRQPLPLRAIWVSAYLRETLGILIWVLLELAHQVSNCYWEVSRFRILISRLPLRDSRWIGLLFRLPHIILHHTQFSRISETMILLLLGPLLWKHANENSRFCVENPICVFFVKCWYFL